MDIPCNYVDESQVIIVGLTKVHDFRNLLVDKFWSSFCDDNKPWPNCTFWEYLEMVLDITMDTNSTQVTVI